MFRGHPRTRLVRLRGLDESSTDTAEKGQSAVSSWPLSFLTRAVAVCCRACSVGLDARTASAVGASLPSLGLIDGEVVALPLGTVEGGNGLVSAVRHLDEAEAARAAG